MQRGIWCAWKRKGDIDRRLGELFVLKNDIEYTGVNMYKIAERKVDIYRWR